MTIVVGVDGSSAAEHALVWAIDEARSPKRTSSSALHASSSITRSMPRQTNEKRSNSTSNAVPTCERSWCAPSAVRRSWRRPATLPWSWSALEGWVASRRSCSGRSAAAACMPRRVQSWSYVAARDRRRGSGAT
ncbi:MAG TPA: universal stress protein, partial [Acidimicrobiales bacterium]|nr:universal stress protein [Acidimicrobiales bacterium]